MFLVVCHMITNLITGISRLSHTTVPARVDTRSVILKVSAISWSVIPVVNQCFSLYKI